MKRLFTFLTAMVLMVSTAIAQVPDTPERSTAIGLRGRNIKTVNNMRLQQRHDQRPVKNVMPLAAEEEAITVPFTHTLGKNESKTNTALYSFVDANNDGKSWKIGGFTGYSVCMKPDSVDIDKMDDWLMSPGIKLEAGKTYTISFEMRYILSAGKKEVLDVHIGTAKEVAAMGETPLFTATATSKDFDVKTGTLTVETDGVYYIGFHAVSLKEESGNMGLCNFSMTAESPEIEKIDPPAAGVVEYEVFPQGQLKAHVKYTAPTKTVTGADLTKIDKVLIVNRWYEKFEYMDVAPGQVIELDVDLFSGKANNRIQATAYLLNSQGEYVAGEEVLVTGIMAGYDYPQSPQNVKAVVSADRKTVTLTWDAVGEVGEDGGYVPADKLKYYIFDAFGSYYDPAIAETEETSYVFDYSALTEQDFFAYQVTASYVDPDGYDMSSLATNSNIITAGPAFELPFKESFSDARFQHVWVYNPESSSSVMAGTVEDNYLQTNADDPDAEPEYINSQDGDNGFFYFMPVNKDDMLGMCSQAVALPQTANPLALDFYAQGKGSVIDVIVTAPGAEPTVERTIDFKQEPTDGWTLFSTDISKYAGQCIEFEIRFRAIHNDDEYTWSVPFDNIRIHQVVDNDLAIGKFAVPTVVEAAKDVTITVEVVNQGTDTPEGASVELYRNGEKIGTKAVGAFSNNRVAVEFVDYIGLDAADELAYKAVVVNEGDELPADNEVMTTATVKFPLQPTVEELAGTSENGEVTLTWQPVTLGDLTPQTVTEDFDNPEYEMFNYTGVGGFKFIDMDEGNNYTFLKDEKNPYRTMPMAFQLWDPIQAGVPDSYLLDCPTHSGNAMLVAWSTNGKNANLLISPELSGEAQTITFYAKGFTTAYPESFTIYGSKTGDAVEDFSKTYVTVTGQFGENNTLLEVWTEYKVTVEEGVKYIAILHDSYDTYALFLDDFTYTAAPLIPADTKLIGYNVYRDSVKVNAEPVTEAMYVDQPTEEPGEYTFSYRVSAVYNNAESRHCKAVSVPVSIIETAISDVTSNGSEAPATYFSIDGRAVSTPKSGIYIRRQGTKVSKIHVAK